MQKVVALAGMLGTLVIAAGCDSVFETLRHTGANTFNPMPFMWLAGPFTLVFAATIGLLGWYEIFKAEPSVGVSTIFLLLGLFIVFSPPLVMQFEFVAISLQFLQSLIPAAPTSFLFDAGGFIAVMGAVGLVRVFKQPTHASQAR